jgi:hypothetical protein
MQLPLAGTPDAQDALLTILQLLVTLLSFPALAALLTGVTTIFSPSRRRRASLTRDLSFLNEMPEDLVGRSELKAQIESALDRLLELEGPRIARSAGTRGHRARAFWTWLRSSPVPVAAGAIISVPGGIVLSLGLGEVSFGSVDLSKTSLERWSLFVAAAFGVVPVVALFAFAARRRTAGPRAEMAHEARSLIRKTARARTAKSRRPGPPTESATESATPPAT